MISRLAAIATTFAALGLTIPSQGATAYIHNELFEQGSPGRTAYFLNDRGEVYYQYGNQGSQPGLWLPAANYGRLAGLNDLPIPAIPYRAPVRFNNNGAFYSIVQLEHQGGDSPDSWSQVHGGSPNGGDANIGPVLSYRPLPSRYLSPDNIYARRQQRGVQGVTVTGLPYGTAEVQLRNESYPDEEWNWNLSRSPVDAVLGGAFIGETVFLVPGMENAPPCSSSTFAHASFVRAASPKGVLLTYGADNCYVGNQFSATLAVVGAGDRTIAVKRFPGGPAPVVNPDTATFSVNDSGAVVGQDAAGLWLSRPDGSITRAGVTNVEAFDIDESGAVWFTLQGDIWKWSSAGIAPLNLPWATWGYTNPPVLTYRPLVSLNNRAQMLVNVAKPNGKIAAVLLSPALHVTLTPSTNFVSIGAQFTVTATLSAHAQAALMSVIPAAPLAWDGNGGVQLLSGPTPVPPANLAAGAQTYWQWTLQATNDGSFQFRLAVQATRGAETFTTLPAVSPVVEIDPGGDLLIKRDSEPASLFTTDNIHISAPEGRQLKTNTIGARGTTRFQVRVENDLTVPATYRLRGIASTNQGWQITLASGGLDLSSVFSGSGWPTPEIAAGASLDVTVTLHDVSAGSNDSLNVSFYLTKANDPNRTLDAVAAVAAIIPVPVDIGMRRITSAGYTSDSITAGHGNSNAPLEPVSDTALLYAQPAINGGWVADGVTPILLTFSTTEAALQNFPTGHLFQVQLEFSGGTVGGTPLIDRLRVLRNGAWVTDTQFLLTPAGTNLFATLAPVLADELQLAGATELSIEVSVLDAASQEVVGQMTLRLRKPPIVLIHGYNTTGDWGDGFRNVLGRSRPFVGEPSDQFIKTARYGQELVPAAIFGRVNSVNTMWALRDLVSLADHAIKEELAPVRTNWAFTRHDMVCHSQGGVLTRMLSSAQSNPYLVRPFRSQLDHYRGRFHRVVTIGSPHNGSRLLRYLLAENRAGFNLTRFFPQVTSMIMVLSDTAQEKFDPFGPQIRELNDPSPAGLWHPDPTAQFHLVRTTINNGQPPWVADTGVVAYHALGLNHPAGGRLVIPRGSDGVVDWDSMGATGPGQSDHANVHTMASSFQISHARAVTGGVDIFGSDAGQVDSLDVAGHVIDALDQTTSGPAAVAVFGSFVMPPLLDDSQRRNIDDWAAVSTFRFYETLISPEPAPRSARNYDQYRFVIEPPTNDLPAGEVYWFAEVTGTNGISTDGVEVTADPGDPFGVTVSVAQDVVGEVILYALYNDPTGTPIVTTPHTVISRLPSEPVQSIAIEPAELEAPAGAVVRATLWVTYASGLRLQRVPAAGEIQIVSSDPSVVPVDATMNWRLGRPGKAALTVSYLGRQTGANWIVTESPEFPPPLQINVASNQVELAWTTSAAQDTLLAATNLAGNSVWAPVTAPRQAVGAYSVVHQPFTNPHAFFRIRRQPPQIPPPSVIPGAPINFTWLGSAPNQQWNNSSNWITDQGLAAIPVAGGTNLNFSFGTSSGLQPLVTQNTLARSIHFLPGASAYTVNRNPAGLNLTVMDALTNSSGTNQTFNLPIALGPSASADLGNSGRLTFSQLSFLAGAQNPVFTVRGWSGIGSQPGVAGRVFVQTAPGNSFLGNVRFEGNYDLGALRLASGELTPLPKGIPLIPSFGVAGYSTFGAGISTATIPVAGQAFTNALQISMTQTQAQPYAAGIVKLTTAPVVIGDHIVARFWIRRVASTTATARIQFNFEKGGPNYDKSVQYPVQLTDTAWHVQRVAFQSVASYAAGAAQVSIWTGYGIQTVEIGAIEVLNYGTLTPP